MPSDRLRLHTVPHRILTKQLMTKPPLVYISTKVYVHKNSPMRSEGSCINMCVPAAGLKMARPLLILRGDCRKHYSKNK